MIIADYLLRTLGGVLIALTLATAPALASTEGLDHQSVTIWSDGSALRGDLFKPLGLKPEEKLPGLILYHGWGGNKANLNRSYAGQFARKGFIVLTFDFRSWGESEGFFAPTEKLPTSTETKEVNVKGKHFRDIVNPLKMVDDARAALNWFVVEPNLQADKIGVWGTSLGGGIALVTAANDNRVKAIVSQVGAVNNKASFEQIPDALIQAWETQRARGKLAPYPGSESSAPGLKGYPDFIAMKTYDPAAYWEKLTVPTLIIDAQEEELFDRTLHGEALYDAIKDRVPSRYLVIPGKHYDIYEGSGYAEALKAAQEWFIKHLL